MNFSKFIATFHTFLVAPLLFYVGWNKGKVNKNIYLLMFFMGLGAIGWHLTKLLDSESLFKKYINIFHILVAGYLFASVGFRQGKAPAYAFTMMLLVAPLVLFYHARRLI